MWERYNDGDADSSGLEDEFLCEYVDGTMDPVVQEVFEEYLRMNPELKRHVECLRNTRLILCRYGCRCHAPRDLHDRLRHRIACELMNGQVPFQLVLSDRLRSFATMTSAMALVFMVGMLAGVPVLEVESGAVPAITLAEVKGSQRALWAGDRVATPLSNHESYLPRMSAFAPLSSVRSLISHNTRPAWHASDSAVAALAGTQSAP